VIPARPLREAVSAAAGRCGAAVLIGADRTGALAHLPPGLPVLHAGLRAGPVATTGPVLAFAGIGRPAKFAETLRAAGVAVAGLRGFPDHHRYSSAELRALGDEATALGARLVTTPKDAVRLPAALRDQITVVGVALHWADPPALEQLLAGVAP
jgi:tetraacyldisaccharide 4'-kinase